MGEAPDSWQLALAFIAVGVGSMGWAMRSAESHPRVALAQHVLGCLMFAVGLFGLASA